MKHFEIMRMVRYYEIPLAIAKRLAKYGDWEERARNWHLTDEGADPPIRLEHLRSDKKKVKYLLNNNLSLQKNLQKMMFGEEE